MDLVQTESSLIQLLSQPWHWAFAGVMLTLVVFLMTWLGRRFGVSSSFETICTAAGAGSKVPYFDKSIKDDAWRVMFVIGAIIGGAISALFLSNPEPVLISSSTVEYLASIGISYPEVDATGRGLVPTAILNFSSVKGVLLAIGAGFLIGFGTRYGRGCTSGHAITGLAHLQLPSLITVIGFFIGGLLMTHLFLPFLLTL